MVSLLEGYGDDPDRCDVRPYSSAVIDLVAVTSVFPDGRSAEMRDLMRNEASNP
jgi:hypothetical protein